MIFDDSFRAFMLTQLSVAQRKRLHLVLRKKGVSLEGIKLLQTSSVSSRVHEVPRAHDESARS